jgi:hypothetical protein
VTAPARRAEGRRVPSNDPPRFPAPADGSPPFATTVPGR